MGFMSTLANQLVGQLQPAASGTTTTTGTSAFAPASTLPAGPSYVAPAQMGPAAQLAAYTSAVPVNPMQQASGAQRAALGGTLGAGTIAGTNLGQYMNPFTQNVIGGLARETGRAMGIGANQLGAEATKAGAFGGSRHGIAQGQMMGDLARGFQQQAAQQLQSGYGQAQAAAQQDIQNRMQQAAQLAALGGQSFGYGQGIQQGLQSQGALQQTMLQALIDASKGQFAGYTGAPATSLGYMGSALGSSAQPTSTTQSGGTSSSVGGSDLISTGLQVASIGSKLGWFSDIRLKESIKKVGELANGIGVYTWEWTKEAIESGKTSPMLKGVLAQEVRKKYPDAVEVDADGYMKVNYLHPELKGAI